MKYCVLHQNNDLSFESTYFNHHDKAFNFCDNRKTNIKAVYKIISRDPLVLGALNVFCSYDDQYCVLEKHFKNNNHNVQFKVI